MTIGKLERKTNKWQFFLEFAKNSPRQHGFHPFLDLWIVNIKYFPVIGRSIGPENYRGFHATINLWPQVITARRISFSLATILGWDRKPLPKWIPERVLMKNGAPRLGLIAALTYTFRLTYPIKIQF